MSISIDKAFTIFYILAIFVGIFIGATHIKYYSEVSKFNPFDSEFVVADMQQFLSIMRNNMRVGALEFLSSGIIGIWAMFNTFATAASALADSGISIFLIATLLITPHTYPELIGGLLFCLAGMRVVMALSFGNKYMEKNFNAHIRKKYIYDAATYLIVAVLLTIFAAFLEVYISLPFLQFLFEFLR